MPAFQNRLFVDGHWLSTAWAALDDRARDMLARRRGNQTLEAIGRAHFVTRERARQIIRTASEALVTTAREVEEGWREQIDELFLDAPAVPDTALREIFPDPEGTARYTLLRALGFESPRTWAGALQGFWTRLPGELDKLFHDLAKNGPYRSAELRFRAVVLGIPDAVPIESVASHEKSPLTRAEQGVWVRRGARSRDTAYLWLAEEGAPRFLDEIVAALGEEHRAVRESLRRDDRFRQIRPEGTWALKEWPLNGVGEYRTTLEVVLAVLAELGPIPKARLITETRRRYPVGYNRVAQCLLSDRVGITANGMWDLVERGATPVEESEPRRPDHVVVDLSGKVLGFRIPVDKDLLRGSSVVIHRWVTWHLGLRQAPMSRTFNLIGTSGDLTVTRNTSAAQVSSLRAHVESMGLAEGCELAVVLRLEEGSARLEHACARETCPTQRHLQEA
ncbi:sigma factor-like helix-turn-helix DNA-binding protein [Actinomadura sp. NEAU-AAG7]|uniref:sigma factor-like helix-turn-helix DNA-binding protein n=1 Tax=Actinomadura sp. NEAU-AAG7 TaxID=2839640 RepID=UPI001BE3F96F|nr:sigma factor-like helix-turn-helix DNA-binding protein [Actinomadura sp. NEAU-AAG7]MBT2207530.1 hypothetical protein [Actinomadura sp. NEAU-AAG7]